MTRRMIVELAAMVWFVAQAARGDNVVDFITKNSVPRYCQLNELWCGPAVQEMILEGYPKGRKFPRAQSDLWRADAMQSDDKGSVEPWSTDPKAMFEVLNQMGPAPDVAWEVRSGTNGGNVFHGILAAMQVGDAPSAVLTYQGWHWVAVVGYTTDIVPKEGGGDVKLKFIEIVDPDVKPCANGDSSPTRMIAGGVWIEKIRYWRRPVTLSGSVWNGKYVGVTLDSLSSGAEIGGMENSNPPNLPTRDGADKSGRPTGRGGTIVVDSQRMEGSLIGPDAAGAAATTAVTTLNFMNRAPYSSLRKWERRPAQLIKSGDGQYYLVPFGAVEGGNVMGGVLVNPYSGEFQEAVVFSSAVTYLSRGEAREIGSKALGATVPLEGPGSPELQFILSGLGVDPFFPVWVMSVENRPVYIAQDGRVFFEPPRRNPGS